MKECACGCGVLIKENRKFVQGHNIRFNPKMYCWNLGLTKENSLKVKKQSEAISESWTDELRLKQSLRLQGNKNASGIRTLEQCKRISDATSIAMQSEEIKRKISLGNTGKVRSVEFRNNLSSLRAGKRVVPLGTPAWNKGNCVHPEIDLNSKVLCKCGCGNYIKIKEFHRHGKDGIPMYLPGHYAKDNKEKMSNQRRTQILPFKDTKIELKMQNALCEKGIIFEKHVSLLGQPDIFIMPNICIFVDGDYWHANPLKYSANSIMKDGKLASHIWDRDNNITKTLQDKNYIVLRFWEFDILHKLEECVKKVLSIIKEKECAITFM